MVSLIQKSAADGLVPLQVGTLSLTEPDFGAITMVAPFKAKGKAVSDAMKKATGVGFPAPGRSGGKAGARVVWVGMGQALVLGAPVSIPDAAITDQTDAWCVLALEGVGAADVLARLTPLDLRDAVFKRGHAARSLLGHMNCLFLRTGATRYELMVFRSMAHTAVHEIRRAMESVTAQAER